MGKLILCSGVRTTRPYVFTQAGVRVYSIEELCYCLYHHIYMVDEDIFCNALFDFIDIELKLPERAEKLRLLKKQNADIKTMVAVVLCSSDYYTEYEIKRLLKILDNVIGMPFVKRNCIKANSFLGERQYSNAATEYDKIINSKEAAELTPEEYGDLFHNLAIAKLHITGLKEASKLFCQAYERNHREDSLRQYLYTLLLSNNEEAYRNKAEEYQIDVEFDNSIRECIATMKKEAEVSEKLQELRQLSDLRTQGKMNDFYRMTDEIIEAWKDKIRQS